MPNPGKIVSPGAFSNPSGGDRSRLENRPGTQRDK
jgi:hypothetical protein